MSDTPIGFIGQGYVGKNYADNFEERGCTVVRYALEEPYIQNKEQIASCGVVFIGVPTPTTPEGFDSSIVREAIGLVAPGAIAVIKSTVLPGTTRSLQDAYPDRVVLFSPEYLSESSAAYDVANPFATIIGMGNSSDAARTAAEYVMSLMPPAPYSLICTSTEAEMKKYIHNINGYIQVVLFNTMYDAAKSLGCDWSVLHEAIVADPYMSARYASPVHQSGRGAGGHCFIKDLAAFQQLQKEVVPNDVRGAAFFEAAAQKNIELLISTGKSLDLLQGVYGPSILTQHDA